jgi:hypothetical protein
MGIFFFFYIKRHRIPNTIFPLKEDNNKQGIRSIFFLEIQRFFLALLRLSTQKKKKKMDLRTFVTQNKHRNIPSFSEIEFGRMEIDPSVLCRHMSSELGNMEICKLAQELIPGSLPTPYNSRNESVS